MTIEVRKEILDYLAEARRGSTTHPADDDRAMEWAEALELKLRAVEALEAEYERKK